MIIRQFLIIKLIQQVWVTFIFAIVAINTYTDGKGLATALETTLNVLSPFSLSQPSGYPHQTAPFGFTQCPYSYPSQQCQLQGTLIHISDTPICNQNDLQQAKTQLQSQQSLDNSPISLLVERGDCSFATTATFVQSINRNMPTPRIEGLLIADHTCLCSNSAGDACPTLDGDCQATPPILDGDANTIHIPTILLQKQDADALKAVIPIRIQLSWPAPTPTSITNSYSERTTIHYWHVPGPYRVNGQAMLPALFQILRAIPNRVQFVPQYYIQSGTEIGCYSPSTTDTTSTTLPSVRQEPAETEITSSSSSYCDDLCTNRGRYCAAHDPENLPFQGVSGADVVTESLRRMCIWHFYGSNATTGDWIGEQYWRYVNAFYDTCTKEYDGSSSNNNNNLFADESSFNNKWGGEDSTSSSSNNACSIVAMSEASINTEEIARCVIRSGGVQDDKDNFELERALQQTAQGLVPVVLDPPPTLLVNNIPYRGQTFSELFGAICASFDAATLPQACAICASCPDDYACLLSSGNCPTTSATTTSPPTTTIGAAPIMNAPQASPVPLDTLSLPPTTATLDPPSTMPQAATTITSADDDDNDAGGGGLSDTMKVVIVVGVVGGAIVVIFAVVMVLVWKLLTRIRRLEKKDDKKTTPTTTSPDAAWELPLPYYVVGKEDPFNNDSEPVPNIASDHRPPPKQTTDGQTTPVAAPSDVVPGDAIVEDEPATTHAATTTSNEPLATATTTATASRSEQDESQVAEKEAVKAKPGDEQGSAAKNDAKNDKVNESTASAADSTSKPARPRASPRSSPRTKPRRRSTTRDPTLIDIMGRAAPEAKIPRSFSYDDEEKEEIVYDELEGSESWIE